MFEPNETIQEFETQTSMKAVQNLCEKMLSRGKQREQILTKLCESADLREVSDGITQHCDQRALESNLLAAQSKSSRELHEAVKLHEADAQCLTNLIQLSEGANQGQVHVFFTNKT